MVLESFVRQTEAMLYNNISIKNAFLRAGNLLKGSEKGKSKQPSVRRGPQTASWEVAVFN